MATVDDPMKGSLRDVSHGSTNLAASYQGANASMTVNVLNNYAGTWSGTYAIRACDQSGAFGALGWCQELGVLARWC